MPKQDKTIEVVEPGFELDEQLSLQKKGWVVQRVGWVMMLVVMIAGATGLFGNGLLSDKTVSSGNTKAEFERFYRYETEMKVLVESAEHISSISFPQHYLKDFRIVRFVPEPFNNNTTRNEVRYNFLPGENRIVSVYLIPKHYGAIDGLIKVNETTSINLDHFIFP